MYDIQMEYIYFQLCRELVNLFLRANTGYYQ